MPRFLTPSASSRFQAAPVVAVILLSLSQFAMAENVDDFTFSQGPITVGPGDVPTEEEALAAPSNVLGGYRLLVPAVDEDALPGASATGTIGGGEFNCEVDMAGSDAGGGCSVLWTDRENLSLDFSEVEAFELEVLEADRGSLVAILLIVGEFDVSQVIPAEQFTGVVAFIEDPSAGTHIIDIDDFINPINPGSSFDFRAVTGVVVGGVFAEGRDGTIRLGPVSTQGPVGGGAPIVPPEPVEKEQVSGTYYNADRDGEGCQLTLEGDDETFVLTCYLYQGGEQAWVIGAGNFEDGEISFSPVTITGGADYGERFLPDDVVRTPWGNVDMVWQDCNNATVFFRPTAAGFLPATIDMTKVTATSCGGAAAAPGVLQNQGTLFDPMRDGEGFQLAVQGDSSTYVLTWYTYLNGSQVWLIGTGALSGNRLVFENLVITRGSGFGLFFNPEDVERTPWGSLVIEYADCNNATATATPLPGQTAFEEFEVDVRKLVPGSCSASR